MLYELSTDAEAAIAELHAEQQLDAWLEAEAASIEDALEGWDLGVEEREDPWAGWDPIRD